MSLSFIFMTPPWMGIGISSFYRELEGLFRGIQLGTKTSIFHCKGPPIASTGNLNSRPDRAPWASLFEYTCPCMHEKCLTCAGFLGDVGRAVLPPASGF